MKIMNYSETIKKTYEKHKCRAAKHDEFKVIPARIFFPLCQIEAPKMTVDDYMESLDELEEEGQIEYMERKNVNAEEGFELLIIFKFTEHSSL